jgi:hypothetical protein
MQRSILIIFSLLAFKTSTMVAQSAKDSSGYGKVTYIQDAQITSLINKHIICSENSKTISGYRVQIHFGSEREKAKEMRARFLKSHPDMNAYELYQQPNFKIRVGDFRTKLEAQRFQKMVMAEFPSSFVVSDDIQLPEIN